MPFNQEDWALASKYTDDSKAVEVEGIVQSVQGVIADEIQPQLQAIADDYATSSDIARLQAEIDNTIETWFYEGEPTASNAPASNWKTDEARAKHVGDLYYDKKTGIAYRWMLDGTTFRWVKLQDTDVTKALGELAELQEDYEQFKSDLPSTIISEVNDEFSAEGELATAYGKVSSAISASANSIKSEVSDTYATKAQLKTTDDKFANYSTTTQMNSVINQSADNVTTEVSKTYATKSSVPTKTSQLTNDSSFTTMSAVEQKGYLTVESDAIKARVTKSEMTTAISDIQVGGRNLLLGSGTYDGWIKSGSSYGTVNFSDGVVTASASGNTANRYVGTLSWLSLPRIELEGDGTYVFSFEVKSDNWAGVTDSNGTTKLGAVAIEFITKSNPPGSSTSGTSGPYSFHRLNNETFWKSVPTADDGKWLKFESNPFKFPDVFSQSMSSTMQPYVLLQVQIRMNGTASFRRFKVERGNKATDWTPAPEDIEAEISTKVDAEAVQEITADAIKNSVWSASLGSKTEVTQTATGFNITIKQSDVTGPKGDTGAAGKTPVKGTDYFTSSEINTIQSNAATAAANSIEVGGRNLVLYSKDLSRRSSASRENRYAGYNNADSFTENSEGFMEIVNTTNNFRGTSVYANNMGFKVGEQFTYSCKIRAEGAAAPISLYIMQVNSSGTRVYTAPMPINGSSPASNKNVATVPAGETQLVFATVEWTQTAQDLIDSGGSIRITFQNTGFVAADGNKVAFYAQKLERGNKATDWTPAPEDVDSSIVAAVDGVQIGGRNLVTDSAAFSSGFDGALTLTGDKYKGFSVRGAASVGSATHGVVKSISGYSLGKMYTFSFWAKGECGKITAFFYGDSGYPGVRRVSSSQGHGPGVAYADGNTIFNITNSWERYWVTYEINPTGNASIAKRLLLRSDSSTTGKSFYTCGWQLEEGNKVSDWTPAPEDVDAAIDSIDIGGMNMITVNNLATSLSANGIKLDRNGYDFRMYGTNTKTDAAYGLGAFINGTDSVLEPGAEYVLSSTAPLPKGVYFQVNTKNASGTQIAANLILREGDTHVKGVVPASSNGFIYGFFGINTTVTTIDFTFRLKLEKGNKQTDWTPAPEDTETVQQGYTILWNQASFTSANDGEGYICAYNPVTRASSDANGWVMWNGVKRNVYKGMINPNTVHPYNIPVYVVCRLASASSTTGINYCVWYNSGWKCFSGGINASNGTAVSAWTWDDSTDIVLGKYVEPGSEKPFLECEIYNPARSSKQLTTSTTTAAGAQSAANDAAKTATNYMAFDSTNGLVVGNQNESGGIKGNVQLTSAPSVNLRNGSTVLASFKPNSISFGDHAQITDKSTSDLIPGVTLSDTNFVVSDNFHLSSYKSSAYPYTNGNLSYYRSTVSSGVSAGDMSQMVTLNAQAWKNATTWAEASVGLGANYYKSDGTVGNTYISLRAASVSKNACELYGATVLASYPSGNNGNVTLNDSLANYTFIDVVYGKAEGYQAKNITRVYRPDGAYFSCSTNNRAKDNATWQHVWDVYLGSGSTLTRKSPKTFCVNWHSSGTNLSSSYDGTNSCIYYVIGYK